MRIALAIAAALVVTPASAEGFPPLVRLYGETLTGGVGAVPKRFVIEAAMREGNSGATAEIDEGWLAPLDPPAEGAPERVKGEVDGTCIEDRCAFSVSGDLVITGDLLKGEAGEAKFVLKEYDETTATGTMRLTPFADTVPGVGKLAAADAISGAELSRLLLWRGYSSGFFSQDDDPPDDFQREPLSQWQADKGRPGGGLILADDLAALRAEVKQVQVEAGWRDGYPSAWLRSLSASSRPGERRYASDDGKVTLLIAADPPISDEAWDAFVDQQTGDGAAGESNGYTRVNDEMEISRTKGGMVTTAAYKHADKALYRMVLTYPEDQAERWAPMGSVLQYDLRSR